MLRSTDLVIHTC